MELVWATVHGGAFQWPLPNVWLGVSVEDQQRADERIPLLLQTPAAVRFLSVEPLLGPISFRWAKWHDYKSAPVNPEDGRQHLNEYDGFRGIGWVIAGGESGPGARPCDVSWVRSIVAQCKAAGVPCFVKQLGANVSGYNPHGTWVRGRPHFYDSKAGDMAEWPEDLRVRQMPEVKR
jgi:protein gp37